MLLSMLSICWFKTLKNNFVVLFLIFRRRQWHPTRVLLPGKSHGWRSLVGCSRWGHKESDMTEWLHFHFSLSCTGEGNGNPPQCSCLENPRDGGAWWAAVYGVAQSRTRLKWLSSRSSRRSLGDGVVCPRSRLASSKARTRTEALYFSFCFSCSIKVHDSFFP